MARLAQRGEIWLIGLGMAAKERPCLILSVAFRDDARAVFTYVARTTALRGGRFEVIHQSPMFKVGAFDAQNLGTVPEARLIKFFARLDEGTIVKIESAVTQWLELKS